MITRDISGLKEEILEHIKEFPEYGVAFDVGHFHHDIEYYEREEAEVWLERLKKIVEEF